MKRLTKEEFIEKANIKHENKYNYSLVEYKNNSTKIDIICPKHGIYKSSPRNHLVGYNCPKCSSISALTNEEFISKSKLKHGNKYDYSLVKYLNSNTKVTIICPIHGGFVILDELFPKITNKKKSD